MKMCVINACPHPFFTIIFEPYYKLLNKNLFNSMKVT